MFNTKNKINMILGKKIKKDTYSHNKIIKLYPRTIAQWVNIFTVWTNDVNGQRVEGDPRKWMLPFDSSIFNAWKTFSRLDPNWVSLMPENLVIKSK